jgi:hypothetical protein
VYSFTESGSHKSQATGIAAGSGDGDAVRASPTARPRTSLCSGAAFDPPLPQKMGALVVIFVTTHCMKEPERFAKSVPDRRRVDRRSDPGSS